MSLITDIYQELSEQLTQNEQEFLIIDSSIFTTYIQAAYFEGLVGGTSLTFTPQINLSLSNANELIVEGKIDVWNLGSTVFQLTIFEIGTELIEFILTPTAFLEDWQFSTSFPSLADSFLNRLDLSHVLLIGSSMRISSENILAGLNFSGNVASTNALSSLATLFPDKNSYAIHGQIIKQNGYVSVELSGNVPQLNKTLLFPKFSLNYDTRISPTENKIELSEYTQITPVDDYHYKIDIPY